MSKRKNNVLSVLDVKKVKLFNKTPLGLKPINEHLEGFQFVRKLMGYALNSARHGGVNLTEWSHLEIDFYIENGLDMADVHFMLNDEKVNFSVLGIIFHNQKIFSFECIGIQPK